MSKKSYVGLDIGESGIRAVEVKRKSGGPKLTRAASVELSPGVIVDGQIIDTSALVAALRNCGKRADSPVGRSSSPSSTTAS